MPDYAPFFRALADQAQRDGWHPEWRPVRAGIPRVRGDWQRDLARPAPLGRLGLRPGVGVSAMLTIRNYQRATTPAELVFLWLQPNATERAADQKAFDALAPELRATVNNAEVQLYCPALLLGQRRYGSSAMVTAVRAAMEEWVRA